MSSVAEKVRSGLIIPSTLKTNTILSPVQLPDFAGFGTASLPRPARQGSLQTGRGHAAPPASVSHLLRSIPKSFRSHLLMSLYHSCGLPLERFPCTNSPYRRSFGIRPSAILMICPSQRRRRCFSNVYMLKIPARSRTTLFGTFSCQVKPEMRRRQRIWNYTNTVSYTHLTLPTKA